ncbi:CCD33 protein, partial [Serilophus lunatus]|nr:CCD33 protein [Serilophus lunatus]
VPMAGRSGEPHIPLALQRSRLKAEEKTLDFEFEVVSAQFNRRGCYALRLTVENPLLQGSGAGIQLRINSGNVAWSSSGTTDPIEQSHLNQIYSFQRRKFTFTLPRGFCKNDKNHDVRLHIEALHFPGRPGAVRRGRRVGEAFFAVYPRPDQPRLKLSARRDEDWYRYSAVLALLRVGSEQPAMHCGRLAFTASLHEHRHPPAPAASLAGSPRAQEEQQAAGMAPECCQGPAWLWEWGNETPNFALLVPKHSPVPWPGPGSGRCHLKGLKKLSVGIWACHIFNISLCSSNLDLTSRSRWAGLQHQSLPPGTIPISLPQWCWGEGASFWRSPWQLSLVSSPRKTVCFQSPVSAGSKCPAQPHNLELPGTLAMASSFHEGTHGEKPTQILIFNLSSNVCIAGSGRFCPQPGCSNDFLCCAHGASLVSGCFRVAQGLEWGHHPITLLGAVLRCTSFDLIAQFQIHLANSLLLPLHYVGDPRHLQLLPFSSRKNKSQLLRAGLQPHLATASPVPAPQWGGGTHPPTAGTAPLEPGCSPAAMGMPRFALPGDAPGGLPGSGRPWVPRHPRARQGMGTTVVLAPSSHPSCVLLPPFSPHFPQQLLLLPQSSSSSSPPASRPSCTPIPPQHPKQVPVSYREFLGQGFAGVSQCPPAVCSTGPRRSLEITRSCSALGWQDVSSCHLALKRMAGDLLSLRRQVTSLEVENKHLRRGLASQEELGHALLHDTDLDIMTREELLDRLNTLRTKLVAGTAETRRLKDRVQQLQNELIRKNDREKELVLLQRAHKLQQATLRRCQEKVAKARGLEETVRQQQKVIEVMERVLQDKLAGTGRSTEQLAEARACSSPHSCTGRDEDTSQCPPPPHPTAGALSGDVHIALLAENRRLREELARDPHPAPPITPGPPALPGVLGGTEKLSLLARLEEAQARGRVLERQLEKAARMWGREKQELGTRLLEREHGF